LHQEEAAQVKSSSAKVSIGSFAATVYWPAHY